MEPSPTLVNPNDIDFDIKNPRGENKQQIESDSEFNKLVNSIKEYSILVPLVVRETPGKKKPFVLVDGERRLRAALITKKKLVPAFVVEKGENDARILSYQIHMVIKKWETLSQLRALKEIRDNIVKRNQGITDRELSKVLRKVTGIKNLHEHLALLKFDNKTIKKSQNGLINLSHLIHIEYSFLNPLKKEFPKLYEQYTEPKLRKILVEKAEDEKLGNTRYLMDHFRELFRDQNNKNELKNSIKKFLDNSDEDICDLVEKFKEKKTKSSKKASKRKASKRNKKQKQTTDKGGGTKVPDEIDHKNNLIDVEKTLIENNIFDLIFNNMRESVKEFEKRANIQFKNEPELQNFIYSILRSLFVAVEFEDPTEKICGKSNRLDFVLKDHKIIVEVKFVRDRGHAKKISEKLSADYLRYKQSPHGKKIINYVYDPEKHIDNQALFKKELKKIMEEANHYVE